MTDTQRVDFTIARFRGVRADDVMAIWSGAPMTAALIFTPNELLVTRVENASLFAFEEETPHRKPVALSTAYEIRAFGTQAELRWTREGVAGEAILFADGKISGSEMHPPSEVATRGETLDVLWRNYRVWGEPPRGKRHVWDGWRALSAGRIGTIHVPFSGDGAGEIVLRAKEYVVSGEFGNAVVLFERLVGFATAEARG